MDFSLSRRTCNLVTALETTDSALLSEANASDEELLRRCACGNNAALEELVRRYQPALGRLLSRLLSSPEDVEDALLNVFVQAWQHARNFQYRSKVSTWLYRIAANLAFDIQKQHKKRQAGTLLAQAEYAGNQENAETQALRHIEHEQQSRALQCALDRMNPSDRLLLVLYYYEQLDYEQIQGIMQLSYTVLKTRLTRARRRLRQFLEEEDREAGL